MKFGHRAAAVLNWILNQCMPPFLRDARPVMYIVFVLAFGREKARLFLDFREQSVFWSPEDFARAYRETMGLDLKKNTDLSGATRELVLQEVQGLGLLDAGCGRGKTAFFLKEKGFDVVACDVAPSRVDLASLDTVACRVEALPFNDDAFDSVICSHVLEHVPDMRAALGELIRVSRKRVVAVLPVERPYRFGFNLHVWFFPYRYSVINIFSLAGVRPEKVVRSGNEWVVVFDAANRPEV